MKMEQRMSLGQRQEMTHQQKLEIETKLKHEQKIQLTQKLQAGIFEIIDDAGGSTKDVLPTVLQKAISLFDNEKIKEAMTRALSDEALHETIVGKAEALMKPTPAKIRDCIGEYFYKIHKGEFVFENPDEKGSDINYTSRAKESVPLGRYAEALNKPEKLIKEINETRGLLKTISSSTALMSSLHEMQTALLVIDSSKEERELLETCLRLVLTKKDPSYPDSAPLLQDFLSESVIFRKLVFTISERIQKRFVHTFVRANHVEPERLHNAFTNTVGEYVLVSMGVIDPKIFQLQSSTIEKEEADELRESLNESGLNYDEICKQYSLKSEGKLFWNRWKTLDLKISADTDDKVRRFITDSIREQKEKILNATEYTEFFSRIAELIKEASKEKRVDSEQLETDMKEMLISVFNKDAFKETIKKLIKDEWYPEIQKFYKKV